MTMRDSWARVSRARDSWARGSLASLPQRALVGLVDHCRRNAWRVVILGILLAAASGFYASRHLGIDTDTDHLFAASLPWRQHQIALEKAFPQSQGLLVAVINADVLEEADATAQGLAQALASDHAHFTMVRRPDASPYLRKEGLLLLSKAQLSDLLDRTIDAQPFLGKLAADPTARGLFSALSLLGQGVTHDDADLSPYLGELRAFHAAMTAAISGHPEPLSWQHLLSGKLGDLGGQYEFVLAQPRLDFGSLQPGGAATQALRAAAAKLEFVRSGAARVRITGPVALADAQFATVAHGALGGLIGSVVLITIWLLLAVRTWRLIVPILGTLGVFIGMLVVYKTGAIRVTPKFTRMLVAGMVGVVVLMLGNLVLGMFGVGHGEGLGLRSGGPLAIIFSLVCIGLAAFSFLIDFDAADQMIRAGAPEKAGWGIALGLTVTLVWLYIEILRLLSYFQRS